MRRLLPLTLPLTTALLLWLPAGAAGQARQTASQEFTVDTPGATSGYRLAIDYFNPQDRSAKPYAVERILQRLHRGARIDTSALPRCQATDAELNSMGESACPRDTRVGGGDLSLDTGGSGAGAPRVIENRVVLFNAEDTLILFSESTNTQGQPIRNSSRTAVGDGTLTSTVPPIPSFPPPDPYIAIKRARMTLDAIERGGKRYVTTPPTCPASGSWTNQATFGYRDGVSQTVQSNSPCRASSTQQRRRRRARFVLRARGIPRRRCASRDFRVRVRVRAPRLRRTAVRVDRRLVRRSRRARFSARVRVRRLRAGRHRITITALDRSGARKRKVVRFRRCRR